MIVAPSATRPPNDLLTLTRVTHPVEDDPAKYSVRVTPGYSVRVTFSTADGPPPANAGRA
ncbi:hypothetical protein MINS_07730 [Mycolicibacterium insubricum]|nr:hypothetical protein MINS_07730 [Mycolicibacterium insubricum]